MNWFLFHQFAEWIIRLAMVPVILHRRLRPTTSLAWLAVIFLVPEVGLILYALFGDARLGRKRIRLHQKFIKSSRHEGRMERQRPHVTRPRIQAELDPIILQAEIIGGMPILGGNHVEMYGDTNELFRRIAADIDQAKDHVHLLYYIYADDEAGRLVSQAMMRAAARGVLCRLLVDSVGSRAFARSAWRKQMQTAGVQVCEALPVSFWRARFARIDLRNHRKLAIIDGRVGYTGSHNIINADYGHGKGGKKLQWVDLSGRYTGPIVHQLQMVFLEDWAYETNESMEENIERWLPNVESAGKMAAQSVPTGPSENDDWLPNVLLAAINAARKKVVITTPYFVPDEPMLVAILMAASRGVDVELIVPRKSDTRLVSTAGKFYYEPLLAAGVRVYQHHAGLLHSKTVTIDDAFALIGSTNMDIRSFNLNFEFNVLMYGSEITQELRYAQKSYLNDSVEIDLTQWRNRSVWKRFASSAASLLSPLL